MARAGRDRKSRSARFIVEKRGCAIAISRFDVDSAVDRLMFINGYGHLMGLPSAPGVTSTATTGVPTNGVAGFVQGALFYNYKASGLSTALYLNSGTVSSATWNAISNFLGLAVVGVAAGYKLARGAASLDGSNPTPIATGLTTVVAGIACLNTTSAPGVSTQLLTTDISGTTLNVYGWKPTASGDCTMIASTGTDSFYWIAVGT